ncbi:motility associated factor glycosyltransferase family protein [Sediminispirochaeta smaragdinae]|uniref:6-hydroxymethylpterin diphosphokinase MptE-like domain-containing protein n=1 Tax=Sediminispirochaeta smaragdinae (strain DSM 11293 / JCM 15392 / SEBR 4228) TaxID=573413 RepID=E1R1B8_SEDSS|nr:6-hydroxymethylpterin diphosphokinase MptE-like protein [Sediminispirochaeta smaragdinae]ADK81059.1 protein of unknown function DUF115 [Sediminispirochaeta smaragdinae DSM 11293]
MSKSTILERNMFAFSSVAPKLSIALGTATSTPNLSFIRSKRGAKVPLLFHEGAQLPLHSKVDPIREGERFYEYQPAGGFLLFLGFAGGYHITPYLRRDDISGILIIEESLSFLKSIASEFDLKELILDPRVQWLVEPDKAEVEQTLLESYLPAVSGDLRVLPLRSRTKTAKPFFDTVASVVAGTIESLSEDYSVQSYFGKRWFTNSVRNLDAAGHAITTIPPIRKAHITGAGPSLEKAIPLLKQRGRDDTLIATDTSLPALLQEDIHPDLVISIDCQHITYHHFLKGFPREIPLVLDLASPIFLSRLSDRPFFFTSGHPFSQYLNAHWRRFPVIDTSGGNVSHAAVSLANSLGAEEIHIYGADFSYPEGKSYARGTYLYPFFHSQSERILPAEHQFIEFIFRNETLTKEYVGKKIRYTTRPMVSYRNRLALLSGKIGSKLIHHAGEGLPIDIPSSVRHRRENNIVGTFFSAGKSNGSWNDFLREYRDRVATLPKADVSFTAHMAHLSLSQRELSFTLFPACAAIRKEEPQSRTTLPGARILNKAKAWTIEVIDSYLP